jgi:hypothetical protein
MSIFEPKTIAEPTPIEPATEPEPKEEVKAEPKKKDCGCGRGRGNKKETGSRN